MAKLVPYRLLYAISNRYQKLYSQDRDRFCLYNSQCAVERRTQVSGRNADVCGLERCSLERRYYGLLLEVREHAPVELHSLQLELPGRLVLRQDLRVLCDQFEPALSHVVGHLYRGDEGSGLLIPGSSDSGPLCSQLVPVLSSMNRIQLLSPSRSTN